MVLMVNEKFLQQTPAWTCFQQTKSAEFGAFLSRVFELCLSDAPEISVKEHTFLIVFLIRLFQSIEHDLVRQQLQAIMGLGTWRSLPPATLQAVLRAGPAKLQKGWDALLKKRAGLPAEERALAEERDVFVWKLIHRFFHVLDGITAEGPHAADAVDYCQRFVELLIDIEALLTSRRFLNTVINATQVAVRCAMAPLVAMETQGRLFRQLLELLKFYLGFEITDFSGEPLTDSAMLMQHYSRVVAAQRVAYEHFREKLLDFALANVASIDTRDGLARHLETLSDEQLHDFLDALHLLPPGDYPPTREFLGEVLMTYMERRSSQIDALNEMPLYPTEKVLWDEFMVPSDMYTDGCLALPKLNLQFLTMFDYLLRNLNLF